jgi:hypothetical protein
MMTHMQLPHATCTVVLSQSDLRTLQKRRVYMAAFCYRVRVREKEAHAIGLTGPGVPHRHKQDTGLRYTESTLRSQSTVQSWQSELQFRFRRCVQLFTWPGAGTPRHTCAGAVWGCVGGLRLRLLVLERQGRYRAASLRPRPKARWANLPLPTPTHDPTSTSSTITTIHAP